jgi:HEAT repeats
MVAATLIAAAPVVLDRGLAWTLAVAGLVVAATCFIAVIVAWRAVAAAKLAAKGLEELRRSAIQREPAPASVAPVAPEPVAPALPPEPTAPEPVAPEPVAPEPVAPEPVAPVAPPEPVAPVAPAQPIQLPDLPSRIPAALWAEPLDPREPRPEPLPSRPPPSGPPDIARWEVVVPSKRPTPPPGQPPVRPPEPPVEERVMPPPAATPTPVRPFVESRPPLPSGEETSLLLRALRDRDPFVRQRAVAALAGRTEADLALVDALRDEYPMVRREVVRALRRTGRSLAVQALVEVVSQDPSAEVREEAVIVLADFLHPGNSNSSTQS